MPDRFNHAAPPNPQPGEIHLRVIKSCGHVGSWPIATDDALTANRRFRGIADMKRFSAPDDL